MEDKALKRCICAMCPTFVKCDEPVGYCLPGREISDCIHTALGCICPSCPVYEERGFGYDYYCILKTRDTDSEEGTKE